MGLGWVDGCQTIRLTRPIRSATMAPMAKSTTPKSSSATPKRAQSGSAKPKPRNSRSTADWSQAIAHLRLDPQMAALIDQVGPCTLSPGDGAFVSLCASIFSQQVSTKVAEVLYGRFAGLFRGKKPTPRALAQLMATEPERVKACGVSRQKMTYLQDLAKSFTAGKLTDRALLKLEDEAIVELLDPIRGIGRWTVEMFLMFSLNRPDVLPVDDFGLKSGMQRFMKKRKPPTAQQMLKRAEVWRPWRTVASWYLWRTPK